MPYFEVPLSPPTITIDAPPSVSTEVPSSVSTEVPLPVSTEVPHSVSTEIPLPVSTEVPPSVPTEIQQKRVHGINSSAIVALERSLIKRRIARLERESTPLVGWLPGRDNYHVEISVPEEHLHEEAIKEFFITIRGPLNPFGRFLCDDGQIFMPRGKSKIPSFDEILRKIETSKKAQKRANTTTVEKSHFVISVGTTHDTVILCEVDVPTKFEHHYLAVYREDEMVKVFFSVKKPKFQLAKENSFFRRLERTFFGSSEQAVDSDLAS